jgi:hypothetical protein
MVGVAMIHVQGAHKMRCRLFAPCTDAPLLGKNGSVLILRNIIFPPKICPAS